MRYPKDLTENGIVGFMAPSFGCAMEPYFSAFNNALKILKEKGHECVLGPNCYKNDGIGISTDPKECGREVNEMFAESKAECLISCGGGELMCEILEHIDWEKIKTNGPKWFVGYSDNTNLTYLLATICDTASIYGPCAGAFGMEPWHAAIHDAYSLLRGQKRVFCNYDKWEKDSIKDSENPLAPYNVTEASNMKLFDGKVFHTAEGEYEGSLGLSGRLLGGCLDILVNLLGTEFDYTKTFIEKYKQDGIVWFLEACDLNVFSIRRALWQMKHAGWFKYTKGFLFGRPLNGGDIMGLDHYNAVLDMLSEYEVPVIMDVDLGHLPPMIPVVIGSVADITYEKNQLKIGYKYI